MKHFSTLCLLSIAALVQNANSAALPEAAPAVSVTFGAVEPQASPDSATVFCDENGSNPTETSRLAANEPQSTEFVTDFSTQWVLSTEVITVINGHTLFPPAAPAAPTTKNDPAPPPPPPAQQTSAPPPLPSAPTLVPSSLPSLGSFVVTSLRIGTVPAGSTIPVSHPTGIITSLPAPQVTLPDLSTPVAPTSHPTPSPSSGNGGNTNVGDESSLFDAIDTAAPPSVFPQEPLNIEVAQGTDLNSGPVDTNKFYANMLLDDQHNPAYVQPYSVFYSNITTFPGMAVSHTDFDQRVYGPDPNANPVTYYINPVGLESIVFSAEEFVFGQTDLTTTDYDTFSVTTTLTGGSGSITLPLAAGMGFVSAEYNNLTPFLRSQLVFSDFKKATTNSAASGIQKWTATLSSNATWNIYVSGTNAAQVEFTMQDATTIVSKNKVTDVVVQVAVVPPSALADDSDIDAAAGMYPVGADVTGSVAGDVATYSITYDTKGTSASGTTLLYLLPHHVESLTADMAKGKTAITADSTTKGVMSLYKTNVISMSEQLFTTLSWLPWSSNDQNATPSWTDAQINLINESAQQELSFSLVQINDNTDEYTTGKIIDRFAYMALVASEVLKNDTLTQNALDNLKQILALWTANNVPTPLMYDTKLKGVTSSAAQGANGSPLAQYGAPYYNDHHFHYGYYVHACAVVGMLDQKLGGNWIAENKDWVNALVRDVANPSKQDQFFPRFRHFDFFAGHSWAKGMFISGAGKDEESSSEDYNFIYGMKMWGNVVGDKNMENRADLMLAIIKRSMNDYFYMEDDNTNQPANFIKNKVPGITFENQLDHTTYFGTNLEYIQGIHMIPVTPVSGLMRNPTFVEQEWTQLLAPMVDSVHSGWSGILHCNQAIYDPQSSFDFFSSPDFTSALLDNGASRTWYLTYSSALLNML